MKTGPFLKGFSATQLKVKYLMYGVFNTASLCDSKEVFDFCQMLLALKISETNTKK